MALKEKIKQINQEYGWLKWVITTLWSVFVFGVGYYVAFLQFKSDIDSLKEKFEMVLKAYDTINQQLTVLISKL